MTLKRIAGCFLVALLGVLGFAQMAYGAESASCPRKEPLCNIVDFDSNGVAGISSITAPELDDPAWARPEAPKKTATKAVVRYQVITKGTVDSSLESFATLVAQTFADSRGWSRMGITFQRVQSGGDFSLILSQAELMTTFSSGCDTTYSCNVGNNVIINNDRWHTATQPWNQSGGSLRDYRHMVVNHETGHWLGHGHRYCSGAGQPAPVMQQQSINLGGCTFNPWPLAGEMFSSRLGIY